MPGREELPNTLKRSPAKTIAIEGRSSMSKKAFARALARAR